MISVTRRLGLLSMHSVIIVLTKPTLKRSGSNGRRNTDEETANDDDDKEKKVEEVSFTQLEGKCHVCVVNPSAGLTSALSGRRR